MLLLELYNFNSLALFLRRLFVQKCGELFDEKTNTDLQTSERVKTARETMEVRTFLALSLPNKERYLHTNKEPRSHLSVRDSTVVILIKKPEATFQLETAL